MRKYSLQFLQRVCPQHRDACLSEVGNAFEDRGGSQVPTGMQDAPILVLADILTLDSMDAFDVDMQLLNQDIQLLRVRQWPLSFVLSPF